jgi:menaquinone-dependent protoporphyrinogen oxidase
MSTEHLRSIIGKEKSMSASILVAYASRHGSTLEVAEAIAAELRKDGLEVDLRTAREVSSVAEYDRVVLGAPLYMMRWHKDALGFLSRHREALTERPPAVFALGPFHDDEKEYQEVRNELNKELAKSPWLKPVAVEIFGGKFDPANLSFGLKLVPALRKMPASDVRDWKAIRDWARAVATDLQSVARR